MLWGRGRDQGGDSHWTLCGSVSVIRKEHKELEGLQDGNTYDKSVQWMNGRETRPTTSFACSKMAVVVLRHSRCGRAAKRMGELVRVLVGKRFLSAVSVL